MKAKASDYANLSMKHITYVCNTHLYVLKHKDDDDDDNYDILWITKNA
jgi:hypothetical protein